MRPRHTVQLRRLGLAVALAAAFYAVERLLGVDQVDTLVDVPVVGFIVWVILEYGPP